MLRLNRLYAATIGGGFYDKNRFPAYCYDKLVLALIDSQRLAGDEAAFALLERTTRAALPTFRPRPSIASCLAARQGPVVSLG